MWNKKKGHQTATLVALRKVNARALLPALDQASKKFGPRSARSRCGMPVSR